MDKQCNLCKECNVVQIVSSRNKSGHCRSCRQKIWMRNNRGYMYAKNKEWRDNNPEACKEYNDQNYERSKHKQIARKKFRYNNDPLYKLRHNLRNRINCAIKREYRSGSAIRDLGCSIEYLKQHIEALFESGMDWKNHGKWHIDHIKPLNSFDLTNAEEIKKVCHYTNLQPLWWYDNLKKGTKYE